MWDQKGSCMVRFFWLIVSRAWFWFLLVEHLGFPLQEMLDCVCRLPRPVLLWSCWHPTITLHFRCHWGQVPSPCYSATWSIRPLASFVVCCCRFCFVSFFYRNFHWNLYGCVYNNIHENTRQKIFLTTTKWWSWQTISWSCSFCRLKHHHFLVRTSMRDIQCNEKQMQQSSKQF